MTDNIRKYKPGKIRERNIERILDAAEHEFVLHGYKGASTQAIANRAGLPKANIHYYFKNKINLYNAVLEYIIELWNSLLEDISDKDDPAKVLEKFIRKKIELAHSHPRASKIFAMEIIQGAPHLKEYIRTDLRQWLRAKANVIESWIEQGKMRKIDPVHLIFLIWSATQHYADFESQILMLMDQNEYHNDDIEHISKTLSDIILGGCGLTPANSDEQTSNSVSTNL